jgi:hypothetical protein
MANRAGQWAKLRVPATYGANNTWYQADIDTSLGTQASCMRLYVKAGIDSPGYLEFYVQHSPDGGSTWYDYCIEESSPHVWGPLIFTNAGAKSIELVNLNLYPNELVRVFFRASAGAGSATIEIDSLAFSADHSSAPQRATIHSPLDNAGHVEVALQDQHTPPIDALFAKEVSAFTLAVDTNQSTETLLYYTFQASPLHGISLGDEIILLDISADKSFYAHVLGVVGDTIEVDRPIDHAFSAAFTLGKRVITNMAVDGSVTPQIFAARAGAVPIDVTRVILQMTDDASMDTSRFAAGPALTRGLVFRVCNSFQKTIFNWKTNGEIQQYCYDVDFTSRAPAGFSGLSARVTFAGPAKHGVTLRIGANDVLQWVVQDDLTDIETLRIALEGHEVEL